MLTEYDNFSLEQLSPEKINLHGASILTLTDGTHPEIVAADLRIVPYCFNESDRLRTVIIGYVDNLYDNGLSIEKNNPTATKNSSIGKKPTKTVSIPEFRNLQRVLEEQGVEVLMPDPLGSETKVINQSYSRDIGFVIGTKFFVSRMKKDNRKREWESITKYIATLPEDSVSFAPEGLVVEGGDIVVDKGNVFVGIGPRTSIEAVDYLEEQLADTSFKIIPVYLSSTEEDSEVLHLDCAFVPVGKSSAIIYEEGIAEVPLEISKGYDLIRVSAEEQQSLATNVLALSPTQVIARDNAERVNKEMASRGIEVITIQFNDAALFGGSIRCCTLPLQRKN